MHLIVMQDKSAAASTEDAFENTDASAMSDVLEHEATTAEMNNAQHSAKSEKEVGDDGASSS